MTGPRIEGQTVEEMQAHLDAVMIVLGIENGERHIEIGEHYERSGIWAITVVEWDSQADPGPNVERISETRTVFSGVTLADAVDALWSHHDFPVICWFCKGEGTFWCWDEKVPADAEATGWRVQTHHDGRRSAHKDCPKCNSERVLLGTAKEVAP